MRDRYMGRGRRERMRENERVLPRISSSSGSGHEISPNFCLHVVLPYFRNPGLRQNFRLGVSRMTFLGHKAEIHILLVLILIHIIQGRRGGGVPLPGASQGVQYQRQRGASGSRYIWQSVTRKGSVIPFTKQNVKSSFGSGIAVLKNIYICFRSVYLILHTKLPYQYDLSRCWLSIINPI